MIANDRFARSAYLRRRVGSQSGHGTLVGVQKRAQDGTCPIPVDQSDGDKLQKSTTCAWRPRDVVPPSQDQAPAKKQHRHDIGLGPARTDGGCARHGALRSKFFFAVCDFSWKRPTTVPVRRSDGPTVGRRRLAKTTVASWGWNFFFQQSQGRGPRLQATHLPMNSCCRPQFYGSRSQSFMYGCWSNQTK